MGNGGKKYCAKRKVVKWAWKIGILEKMYKFDAVKI